MKTRLLWRYRSAWKFLRIQSFQPVENMFCTYKQRHNLHLKKKIQYLLLPYCELPFTCLIVLQQASTVLPTYKAMHCWVLYCQQAKSFGMQPVFLTKATCAFSSSWLQLLRLSWILDPLGVQELIFLSIPTSFLSVQMTGKEVQMKADLRCPTPWLSELLAFSIILQAPVGLYQLLSLDGWSCICPAHMSLCSPVLLLWYQHRSKRLHSDGCD